MVENGVGKKRPFTGISRGNARDAMCAFKFAPSCHAFDLHTFLRLTQPFPLPLYTNTHGTWCDLKSQHSHMFVWSLLTAPSLFIVVYRQSTCTLSLSFQPAGRRTKKKTYSSCACCNGFSISCLFNAVHKLKIGFEIISFMLGSLALVSVPSTTSKCM